MARTSPLIDGPIVTSIFDRTVPLIPYYLTTPASGGDGSGGDDSGGDDSGGDGSGGDDSGGDDSGVVIPKPTTKPKPTPKSGILYIIIAFIIIVIIIIIAIVIIKKKHYNNKQVA
jgi:hypothetical protein